jgi:hypothetical protein
MSNPIDMAEAARISLERRKEHFRVEVERDHDPFWHPNAIVVKVTRNGFQWEALQLLPKELNAVLAALQNAKREMARGNGRGRKNRKGD